MTPTTTPLLREGVYLFRAPSHVTVQVNRELVVVFATNRDACGVILFDAATGTKAFEEMAETLFAKVTLGLGAGMGPIHVKLFGASHAPYRLLQRVREWLDERGLKVVAQDLGKNVRRSIAIDCATGAVGVSYSESFVAGVTPFLAQGSVRQRRLAVPPAAAFLVLSGNPVTRTLATQVIEETPGFLATAPADPQEIFTTQNFGWTHVLLFDDLAGPSAAGPWIEKLTAANPEIRCFWVAERLPEKASAWLERAYWLPPLAPESIGSFKHAFIEAVLVESSWNPIPEVVTLAKVKKRQR